MKKLQMVQRTTLELWRQQEQQQQKKSKNSFNVIVILSICVRGSLLM